MQSYGALVWRSRAAGEIVLAMHRVGNDRGESSMVLMETQTRAQAIAVMEWRDAAELVSSRWRTYLDAEPDHRAFAFASYVSALDAEEAAAVGMLAVTSRTAA
jgi:hypothetical protein